MRKHYCMKNIFSLKHCDCAKIQPLISTLPLPLPVSLRYFFFLFSLLSLPAVAAPDWSMCSTPAISSNSGQQSSNDALSETRIESNYVFSKNQQLFEFSGDVKLSRADQDITADELRLDKITDQMDGKGNISFSDTLVSMSADEFNLNNRLNSSFFSNAEFSLLDSHFRGNAGTMYQLEGTHKKFTDVRYTTCDPGNNAWTLSTKELSLDQQSGRGTAKHAVLRIRDLPVFYIPWFQFPIDNRRMSGILSPTITTSNNRGTEVALPVYWNMSENYDMTITPVNYTSRGLQLNTENRYLFNQQMGQLDLSYLNDEQYPTQRWFRRWQHEADFFGIHASLLSQKVSDEDFLEEFDHLSAVEFVDYLKSSARFTSNIYDWSASLLFEEYDPNNQNKLSSLPYRRLPQLTINRRFQLDDNASYVDWRNEYVSFDKEGSINGSRLQIKPRIATTIEGSYYFLKPQLELNLTQYNLDDNQTLEQNQSRSLALFSIDSGLFFERQADSRGRWLQTLEPRLYALYVPYKDQSGIPVFDSSLLSENYASLFVNNRFSGADRIGDSKQISLGISTRFLNNNSGRELFSASIGQAFYSEQRRVSLNSSVDIREKSSIMTLMKYQPTEQWNIQLASVFDQINRESEQTDISFRRRDTDSTLNLEYHFRENDLEQTTVSFVYPLNPQWNSFAKRQHSIKNDRLVQNLIGFAYESCCWAFKALYEEKSDTDFESTDYSVYFQLTFKGLTNAGKDIDALLEDGILGYLPPY